MTWLLAAVPAATLAQEQPGLDLSQPPPPASTERDGEELPPLDLGTPPPAPPRKDEAPPAEEKPRAVAPFSEKDVALGDKVKAVQRKGFLKKGRLELAPIFAATVNDAFYQKFGYGLRLAYNLHDSFAIAVRGTRYAKYRSDNVREGKLAFQSQLLTSDIEQQVMLGGVWSPIYGKASFLQDDIIHFDLYLSAGFGLVWSSTSGPPLDQGAHVATDFGGGVRFYPKEWLAFELGLLATLYPDQPIALLPATVQKVFVANVGVSFFWPFTFDYVHP
jgi:outer membrane beta-barrel protein